jgi:hypothetical protein
VGYKRNQVEEAIATLVSPSGKPNSELRTRIKRLLELDRARGRTARGQTSGEPNFAFFSEDAPGTGANVWFSGYDAFAILSALRIMGHGWPRGFAVSVMRRVRPELERQHDRILKQDPEKLFDQERVLREARPGDIAVDTTDPVFLVLTPGHHRGGAGSGTRCAVCRGMNDVSSFIKDGQAASWTQFELTTMAYRLARELEQTKPRHRGRG